METVNKVRVKIEYDFKTMKHYNYYNLRYRSKKGMLVFIIPLIIVIGVAILFVFRKDYIFSIALGLLALYLVYQIVFFEKVIDSQIEKYFLRNPRVVTKEIEIDENEIRIYNPGEEQQQFSYPWEYITEIHDTPEFIFLMAFRSAPVIINKNPEFFVSGTLDELQQIILEKAQTKPYKVFAKPIVKRPITFVHPPHAREESDGAGEETAQQTESLPKETPSLENQENITTESTENNE
ncbi:MAG TPA: SoxR reducing system RseC family protein [Bacilli bacterium]|nr:SoxR reducing system RseC family protein [Bacilli bacterium]